LHSEAQIDPEHAYGSRSVLLGIRYTFLQRGGLPSPRRKPAAERPSFSFGSDVRSALEGSYVANTQQTALIFRKKRNHRSAMGMPVLRLPREHV
jgi:hypothetical protein